MTLESLLICKFDIMRSCQTIGLTHSKGGNVYPSTYSTDHLHSMCLLFLCFKLWLMFAHVGMIWTSPTMNRRISGKTLLRYQCAQRGLSVWLSSRETLSSVFCYHVLPIFSMHNPKGLVRLFFRILANIEYHRSLATLKQTAKWLRHTDRIRRLICVFVVRTWGIWHKAGFLITVLSWSKGLDYRKLSP